MRINDMAILNEILEQLDFISSLDQFKQQTLTLFETYFQLPHSIFWLCQSDFSVFEPTMNNMDATVFASYVNNFSQQDILLPENIFSYHKRERVLTILDVVPKTTYEKSTYFNDFMRANDFVDELGLYLYKGNTLIGGISFATDSYRFIKNGDERRLFEVLSHFLSMKLEKLIVPSTGITASTSEKRVFERLRKGETDEQIAEQLHLSIYTVKKHLRNMYKKNGVPNRTALLAKIYKG